MYQITSNGVVLGYTDLPEYCYKLPSGSAQVIGHKEWKAGVYATGVIYQGKIYNLPGHYDFDADTASVTNVDAGAILMEHTKQIAEDKSTIGGERAPRMYDVGELLTVDGKLYRVKIQIPAGGYIAPGANVEETSIIEELLKK